MSKIDVSEFFQTVQDKHATGQATEHSYRPALEKLLKSINPKLTVINEPKQLTDIGKPDFVIMRDDVPVGYVEAKDVGLDIRKMKGANKDQHTRYVEGLPNLIYTNGLDFDFYRWDASGEPSRVAEVSIGDYLMGLQPKKTQFPVLEDLLYDFVAQDRQALTITSASRLAKIMARKGRLMRHSFGKALIADTDNSSDLAAQYLAFQDSLIHDITKDSFADIYAETIVYGMFAARYHDTTPEDFSRQEALELLPKSNPFLYKLFKFIASNDLPKEIEWTIDELVSVYRATNVTNIMSRWSDSHDRRDPFLHFYETFLAEYNPAKRKSRGVWYTPEAVVNFIVRAVDDVLKTEFNEPMGLASTNKIPVKVKTGTKEVGRKGNKRREDVYETQELHRVQILDPATGTGTFLAEVINQIEPRIKAIDEGGWSDYVEHDLKPRLHGFELLMASYAMCHLKLDMMLAETGYVPPKNPKRLSVWLTNSLEEPQEDDNSLPLFGLARAINDEAKGANDVKADKPIMCIIGNPPYSGESANKGEGFEWIEKLLRDYKTEAGGKEKLKERNSKWINDDYVKFIRYSQHLIANNEEGILAFVTNNGYLDNPTFRGMRWSLSDSFDNIYIFDLHGSMKKREVKTDGTPDKNVFDIQQGVCIIVAVKNSEIKCSKKQTFYCDILGSREEKNEFLADASLAESFKEIYPQGQFHLFVPRDYELEGKYNEGIDISKFMPVGVMGFQTHRDQYAIAFNKNDLMERLLDFENLNISDQTISQMYGLKSNRDWKISIARDKLRNNHHWEQDISHCLYRPLDIRTCHLSYASMDYPRTDFIQHSLSKPNLILGVGRQGLAIGDSEWGLVTVSTAALDANVFRRGGVNAMHLYLYPDENDLDQTRRVNMEPKIRAKIEQAAMGIDDNGQPLPGPSSASIDSQDQSIDPMGQPPTKPDEVAIFDYIYGVLHCPAYRETYAEFLKIDFPRVPYPSSPDRFWDISAKGAELRALHLMDGVDAGTTYPFKGEAPEEGSGFVETIGKKSFVISGEGRGNVMINDSQYFEGVPAIAWEFYIGGYQPAQKWLKDRKGRTLSFDDRMHYRKIIHILMETDRIMKTIDMDL